mgnify:CR=1 FL=1
MDEHRARSAQDASNGARKLAKSPNIGKQNRRRCARNEKWLARRPDLEEERKHTQSAELRFQNTQRDKHFNLVTKCIFVCIGILITHVIPDLRLALTMKSTLSKNRIQCVLENFL